MRKPRKVEFRRQHMYRKKIYGEVNKYPVILTTQEKWKEDLEQLPLPEIGKKVSTLYDEGNQLEEIATELQKKYFEKFTEVRVSIVLKAIYLTVK